jgi:pyridoxamine 5'-phosphate oxidase
VSATRRLLRGLPVFGGDLPEFDPDAAPDRPEDLFVQWLTEAVADGVREPHAMTLSTIGPDGAPSARVLLLKDVDSDGWRFASHGGSPKGRQLAAHPAAALTFYWPEVARQVRIRGTVQPGSAESSAADFLARSPGARAESLAGRQSQILDSRRTLALTTERSADRVAADPGLVVPEWTLYTVRAEEAEFWQADKQRQHTRLRYVRDGDSWIRNLLWP